MRFWADLTLVSIALTSLLLLGSSRLLRCIRLVAFQGILLGALTLVAHPAWSLRSLVLAAVIVALKGVAFPWLLARVLKEADVSREVEPFVPYNGSLLVGTLMLVTSFWVNARLVLPTPPVTPFVVPLALFTTLAGLFLVVSRRKALTQVIGYLVLENGIYAFGAGVAQDGPLIVEIGVLLDVFVAVFVMGIAIFHINREFDAIDTDRLASLHDWTGR